MTGNSLKYKCGKYY